MGSMTTAINALNLDEITSEIKRTMRRSAKDAVQLGYMLRRVLEERLYLSNYGDFDTYIQSELQMDYTMASRFIKINKKYSYLGKSMDIATQYEQYSQGLLIEMLNMTPEQEAAVTPETTVKQAREIKRQAKIPTAAQQREEVIIDGAYREIKEPEKVATSQPVESLSAYGFPKTEYEQDSLPTTKGCGHKHDCFLCAMDCHIREEVKQPELPNLKNNDARKAWLEDYKAWGLWYRDEHIDVNYYKYDFADGSRLVVAEYPLRFAYWTGKRRDEHYYHLLEKNKKGYQKTYDGQYRHSADSETYLVEFLKNLQKKG